MARMNIEDWHKSPDGVATINEQKVFCIGGDLWQGFKGSAIKAHEDQMETWELKIVRDIDNTMSEVYFRRRQRLEARNMRKSNEMDDRRAVLRKEINEIRVTMKADKEDGLPVNPANEAQLRRLYKRMERLELAHDEAELAAAEAGEQFGNTVETTDEPGVILTDFIADQVTCDWEDCASVSPPGHKDPTKWLRAHRMGKHLSPQAKAKKKREAEGVATA